jgi:hypothetical protein
MSNSSAIIQWLAKRPKTQGEPNRARGTVPLTGGRVLNPAEPPVNLLFDAFETSSRTPWDPAARPHRPHQMPLNDRSRPRPNQPRRRGDRSAGRRASKPAQPPCQPLIRPFGDTHAAPTRIRRRPLNRTTRHIRSNTVDRAPTRQSTEASDPSGGGVLSPPAPPVNALFSSVQTCLPVPEGSGGGSENPNQFNGINRDIQDVDRDPTKQPVRREGGFYSP